MTDDRELETAFAALMPAMQHCGEMATAKARGREKKKARVIDALFAEVGAYIRGRHDPAYGIGGQVSDLASTGQALPAQQAAAVSALASFAYALEAAWDVAAGRGTRESVYELLEHAQRQAAESRGDGAPKTDAGDIAARVEKLQPGDDRELAAVVAIVMEHRRVDLVPGVLERLGLIDDTDTIDHAVRSMGRLFERASDYADLCARLCASPNAGTRRWVARALISGLRPEHVDALIPLLSDHEPKVRREAATVLRAAAVWHPATKPAIEKATKDAMAAHHGDHSLTELSASLRAPPPTTR